MDQSYSDSDVTLSPSALLKRLQVLRSLQLLNREKLQRQKRLEYHESPETTSSITELVSHFSNSTSNNTFRSLLQSTEESNENYADSECAGGNVSNLSKKDNIHSNIDGVAVLNLSNVSEPPDTPASSKSSDRRHSEREKSSYKKQISLDEMPVLSSKTDFGTLVVEKLNKDMVESKVIPNSKPLTPQKRQFLRRGEGMVRFGLQKKSFVIQNTKSLPWRQNSNIGNNNKLCKLLENKIEAIDNEKIKSNVQVDKPQNIPPLNKINLPALNKQVIGKNKLEFRNKSDSKKTKQLVNLQDQAITVINSKSSCATNTISSDNGSVKAKQTPAHKEKTWASVLTKEQDDFLRQLKQSSYYKNFVSPVKSITSDLSCDENNLKLQQEIETAEQNMFELLEKKASNESFNLNYSLLRRVLTQNSLECSGESTPIVMQKCLSRNPNLMHLLPEVRVSINETTNTDCESCYSECLDCNACCSSVSECNSCKTCSNTSIDINDNKEGCNKNNKVVIIDKEKENQKDSMTVDTEVFHNNMVEMNAKLNATSEFFKERLLELEYEIETFRKENANLKKMRQDIELERQKFYEEKSTFEQKFNEEKVLSEYYLAEETEKLSKQKQMYDRYVKDIRGRLSKKEKDEVVNLKKEISDLKEEIRSKDAKSTSTIARLRNQLKITEKEKKNLEEEREKLKKENRCIQHSNDISRRLTNIKYLEEINKKLNNMACKDAHSNIVHDSDMKYKAFEIEQQNRSRKFIPARKGTRTRAISVPNLNVTSRYAKYFSQKDSLSEKETFKTYPNEHVYPNSSHNDISNSAVDKNYDNSENRTSDSESRNNLEDIYNMRFKSVSPTYKSNETFEKPDNNDFFLRKATSTLNLCKSSISLTQTNYDSLTPHQNINQRNTLTGRNSISSTSPNSMYQENEQQDYQRSPSPVSILSNKSSSSQKCGTVINKETCFNPSILPSPEPVSKGSLMRTNLNPTEIRKPDGTKEIRFPNGNIKTISADGHYSKFVYYNGDIKENFYNEGRMKYYYAESQTSHTTHPDRLEVLEFPDGQVEKRYKDGSSEIRFPNGSIYYFNPKNEHVREEWRFPDGAVMTISAKGEKRIVFANGQIEVYTEEHKRREFPDGTVKLVFNDGTTETRYSSGRVRIKDKHGNLIMDSDTRH